MQSNYAYISLHGLMLSTQADNQKNRERPADSALGLSLDMAADNAISRRR